MADAIQYDTRVKDASEVVAYLFDYSRFPETKAGETWSSPVVTSSPSGLTIGTPAVTTADLDGIDAGQAVQATISGGTADTSYSLKCRATSSGGAQRVVDGVLKVQ